MSQWIRKGQSTTIWTTRIKIWISCISSHHLTSEALFRIIQTWQWVIQRLWTIIQIQARVSIISLISTPCTLQWIKVAPSRIQIVPSTNHCPCPSFHFHLSYETAKLQCQGSSAAISGSDRKSRSILKRTKKRRSMKRTWWFSMSSSSATTAVRIVTRMKTEHCRGASKCSRNASN